jgi:hypothetical protein
MQTEFSDLSVRAFLSYYDETLVKATNNALGGLWKLEGSDTTEVGIHISEGSLYINRYIINGTDALATMNEGEEVPYMALWATGNDEFRLVSWITSRSHLAH